MSIEKQAGKDLGILMGASAYDIDPKDAYFADGAVEEFETEFRKAAHKKVMKSLYEIMVSVGDGDTKTAKHINALSKVPIDHNQHTKQASNDIFNVLTKKADLGPAFMAGALSSGSSSAIYLAGLLSAVGGAGAGALYWGADRSAKSEDAETEAKRKKIQYYRELSQDLQRNSQKNYDL